MIHQGVTTDHVLGSPLLSEVLMNKSAAPPTMLQQTDPAQPQRQDLTTQEDVNQRNDVTRGIDPSHEVVVDVGVIIPDYNPTRQNA